MRSTQNYLVGLSVLAALGVARTVQADVTESTLEEVVVTANKRESTVQETPASITAVSAADIADRGLVDFNALAESVPGISMRTSGPGQTEFEMRGLNSSGGNTSMVGFYLDETPLSSPANAQVGKVVIDPNLYDLNRVEVLRGPQGTLYGSSSMGGTVKVVPNMPLLGDFEASGETRFSDTQSADGPNSAVNAMVNIPIGDSAALRIVGSSLNDSGWIKRDVIQDGAVLADSGTFPDVTRPANFYTAPLIVSYPGANSTSLESARATLLWKPVDALSITPMVMWQRTLQDGSSTVDVNGTPTHPTVPAVNAHYEIYDMPEPQLDRFTLESLKLEYQFDSFSLTSATGYWNRNTLIAQDGSEENASAFTPGGPYDVVLGGIGPAGPTPFGPAVMERDYTYQTTEELRATSTGKGPLQWIVGYFYQDLNAYWDEYSLNPQLANAPSSNPLAGQTNTYVDFQPQVIIQNSFFGELSYKFTPDLKATVGLRHYSYSLDQHNEEYGTFTVYEALGNTTPYFSSATQRANGTDPKFDLSWTIRPDALVYATASKGFRLGGANQPIPVALANNPNTVLVGNECSLQAKLLLTSSCNPNLLLHAPSTFESDSVWNYEVGEKVSFLDRQLEVNTSVYYESWQNPQIATNLAGFGITVNGANAHIIGVESELRALLPAGFNASANVGYTHATFSADSSITGFQSGMNIPDTPQVTGSLVLTNHQRTVNNLELVGSLEFNYVGTRTDAPYGETVTLLNVDSLLVHLPSYELLNLRYGVHADRWTATAFITNVANKEVLLDPQPQINLQTAAFTRYIVNQPRTIGIDLTYRLGK